MTVRYQCNEIEWLEFDLLSDIPKLKHAVFLRHGGVSEGPFHSLNTDDRVGDNPQHVKENIERIKGQLKHQVPSWKQTVIGKANHGTSHALVTEHSPEEILGVDGLLTKQAGVTLLMRHADCQVALFYDTKNHAIACVHAGWRGSVANIYKETIQSMKRAFGSNPSDLLVCISPSLGPYEAEFINYQTEIPEELWHFQAIPTYFDFWSMSEFQLQNAGVLPHHIEIARLSTFSNPHDFFSYRRDKVTGRHATCITLVE